MKLLLKSTLVIATVINVTTVVINLITLVVTLNLNP